MNAQRRDALLKEYGEVSNLFRTLTDIRFRLLGILPIASAVTAALGARSQNGGEIGVPLALALFGLAAAIGVVTYNARNDQLYNELVGRAAAIERSVGLPDGAFSNRPRPWLRYKLGRWTWHIDHGHGIATIYAATIAFWLFLSIDASLHLIGLPPLPAGGAEASAHSDKVFDVTAPPATLPALGTTALVLGGAWWLLRRQRRARDRALRSDVRAAMDLLAAFDNDLTRLKDHPQFLKYCAGALAGSEATVSARAEFYSELAPEALGYYALTGSKLHKAASLVSLLTDLPPLWVFDLMLNRLERSGRGTGHHHWRPHCATPRLQASDRTGGGSQMDELQVVLAQRAVFVAGGVLCVLLAVQLIGKHRAIAERLERATTDLKWVIADARRAITEAREEAKHLTTAELSAIEQEQKLEWHSGQGKLESARKSASDQQEQMTKRLNDMEGTVQRVLGDRTLLKPQAGAVWNSILAVLTLALAGFLFICASRVPPPILLAIF